MGDVVYLVGNREHGWYKIGFSRYFRRRLENLQSGVPFPLETISLWETDEAWQLEQKLHEHFAVKVIRGEWFCLSASDLEQYPAVIRAFHPVVRPARKLSVAACGSCHKQLPSRPY